MGADVLIRCEDGRDEQKSRATGYHPQNQETKHKDLTYG
jgi:hypothetical protein